MSDEIERLRIYAVKSREAMLVAFPILRRVRDCVDAIQHFEADAAMKMMEEAFQCDTASTAPHGATGTIAGTSSPATAGAASTSSTAPSGSHEIGLHRSEQDGMGTFGITPGHGERPAQEGAATPLKHPATGGPEGNVAKPQCDPIGHRITHPPAHPDGPLEGVTRLEVIDDTGRAYARWNVKVETSYQDQGRTLKLFVGECVHQVCKSAPNAEQARFLVGLLRSAQCPDPNCSDGSIRSTGPDPQDDACEWCYQRHETIKAFEPGGAWSPAIDSQASKENSQPAVKCNHPAHDVCIYCDTGYAAANRGMR